MDAVVERGALLCEMTYQVSDSSYGCFFVNILRK